MTDRSLIRGLRALGSVNAPQALRPRVLTELGLVDSYVRLGSALGPVYVAFNRTGVCAVARAESPQEFEKLFFERFGRVPTRSGARGAPLVQAVERQLRGEPAGRLRFDLRQVSEFEQAVLRKALEIPRGQVRSYAWIAREIGNPKAVRAVGSALGRNPIPLLIPCHRVVRSDGVIGEYGMGGPRQKRRILEAEGAAPAELERLARAGVRFVGSDTTRIYCFPTCANARRIGHSHRVDFASDARAAAAGYRPCSICRPAA